MGNHCSFSSKSTSTNDLIMKDDADKTKPDAKEDVKEVEKLLDFNGLHMRVNMIIIYPINCY